MENENSKENRTNEVSFDSKDNNCNVREKNCKYSNY